MSMEDPLALPGLVHKALKVLVHWSDPDNSDTVIPDAIIRDCAGLAFISTVKAGFLVTVSAGLGIVIARDKKGNWTGPIKVGTAGIGGGAAAGIGKTDAILVLNDSDAVKAFRGGQVKLGADLSLAIGPIGREASLTGHAGKKFTGVFSYGIQQGLYGGLTLDGAIMTVKDRAIKHYYGRGITAKQVLEGEVKMPKWRDLATIHKILNAICKRAGPAPGSSLKGPSYRHEKKDKPAEKKMPRTKCPNCKKGIRPPVGASKFRCPWCSAVLQYKPPAQPWECTGCTYVNKPTDAKCAMCQIAKGFKKHSSAPQATAPKATGSAPVPKQAPAPIPKKDSVPPPYVKQDSDHFLEDMFASNPAPAPQPAAGADPFEYVDPFTTPAPTPAPAPAQTDMFAAQAAADNDPFSGLVAGGAAAGVASSSSDPFSGLGGGQVDPFAQTAGLARPAHSAPGNYTMPVITPAGEAKPKAAAADDPFADLFDLVALDFAAPGNDVSGAAADSTDDLLDIPVASNEAGSRRSSFDETPRRSSYTANEIEQGAAEYREILKAIQLSKSSKKN